MPTEQGSPAVPFLVGHDALFGPFIWTKVMTYSYRYIVPTTFH